MTDMIVEVTSNAAEHIAKQLAARDVGLGIKLGVKTTGCSGLSYFLEFVDETTADDIVESQHGVKFFIDPAHQTFLRGSRLVLKVDGLNAGLEFENPNATGTCGCGESFSVDE